MQVRIGRKKIFFLSCQNKPVPWFSCTPAESAENSAPFSGDPEEPVSAPRSWAKVYTGDGEEYKGVKYVWEDPPAVIAEEHFHHPAPQAGPELETMFRVAPLWRLAANDRVVLRPCRWLSRPQVGVFVRSARINAKSVLVRCRTTMVRTAGGYDIRVPAPSWHPSHFLQGDDRLIEFFVSPSCPSVYINCGERGVAATASTGNNCDWEIVRDANGNASLVIIATASIRPHQELLVPYGWRKKAWKAADRGNETLMQRYLNEVTGEPGYQLLPPAAGPASNRNPF
jgi:hypothetical protein